MLYMTGMYQGIVKWFDLSWELNYIFCSRGTVWTISHCESSAATCLMTFVCECEWNKLNENYEQDVLAGPVFWRVGGWVVSVCGW